MNAPLLVRSVLLRLWRYKAKTLFMGLGIMVAVLATVLLLTTIASVKARFKAFNAKNYPPNGVQVLGGGGPMSGSKAGRDSIKLDDMEALVSSLGTAEWDPFIATGGYRDVKRGGNNLRVGIIGYSERAESVRDRSVQEGEFFSAEDVRDKARVVLIGTTTAKRLFPGESAVGGEFFIDNIPFQVKGILEEIGVGVHGDDQDNLIWMPYTTLADMLKVNYVSGVLFLFEDKSRVEPAREEITRVLRERHQIAAGQKDDFSVITSVIMQQMFEKSFKTFDIFIPLIAGTAFLISALVILSIMQISIKGRTQEIGLRKAMGARSGDLQTQIVLEVVCVAVIASLIGILLAQLGISAVLAPLLMEKLGVKQQNPSILVLVVAVGAALATGLLGGVLPARRAAKLKPVEALKQ